MFQYIYEAGLSKRGIIACTQVSAADVFG